MTRFPRTNVSGVSMPRLLMGTNRLLGYSHIGAGSEAEAREDIDISLAVLERRAPNLEAGSSPFKQSILEHK